ncbi:MAG: hypothetical protein AABX13_02905 [Nanoarchaeota archaeon]
MAQLIYPSIIARNQQELKEKYSQYAPLQGIVKTLHLDIVDGRFAPNKSLQFPFKLSSQFRYDAHLMIKDPELWIKRQLRSSGLQGNTRKSNTKSLINLFIPHFEAIYFHSRYILWMRQLKKPVAFAILPETNVTHLKEHLPYMDYVLVLAVHPGFYGSKYMHSELLKIKPIKKVNPRVKIIVDGGMNPETITEAKKAGADLFVSGSYLVNNHNARKAFRELKRELRY